MRMNQTRSRPDIFWGSARTNIGEENIFMFTLVIMLFVRALMLFCHFLKGSLHKS